MRKENQEIYSGTAGRRCRDFENYIGTIEIGKKLIENFAQFVENQFV